MIRKHKEHAWNPALSSHSALFVDPLLEKTIARNPVAPIKVDVIGVHMNKSKLKLKLGQTEELAVSIIPENATNQNVNWVISNPDVVKMDVQNRTATVKGNRVGRTIIVVSTEDGKYRDLCEVTVHNFLNGR
jgi:uncharacterized protein YjdB